MRSPRYSPGGIGAGIAIFLLLAVLQVACSGSDKGSEPGPTAGGDTPGTTGGTVGGPQGSSGPFTGPVEGGFISTPLAADETPATPFGVVLADPETGDGEYWRAESAADQQGEFYGIDSGHRWLQWLDSAGRRLLIADRQTGETYALDSNVWVVVAGPSASGVLVLQQNGAQTFAVVDLAHDPLRTRLSFQLSPAEGEQSRVLLVGDGKALLFAGNRIDLTTGEITEHVVPDEGYTTSFAAKDGGWLDITFAGTGSEASLTTKRFDAAGEDIALDAAPPLELEPNAGSFSASPDGRWVALSLGMGLSSPPNTQVWPTVAIADLQTGDLAFRAVRASMRSGLKSLGWLPDSSGLLVATSESFALLTTDGTLQALPFGPVEQADAGGVPVPVAAPNAAGRYLFKGRIVAAHGEPMSPEIAAAAWGGTEPWNNYGFNLDGSELRFMQSQSLGRDYQLTVLTSFGLPAKIERPPFPGQLDLRVTQAMAVHPAPDEGTASLADLAAGDTLTVLDEPQRKSSAWPQAATNSADFSVFGVPWFVYVRTATGIQGWVRTDALGWP